MSSALACERIRVKPDGEAVDPPTEPKNDMVMKSVLERGKMNAFESREASRVSIRLMS